MGRGSGGGGGRTGGTRNGSGGAASGLVFERTRGQVTRRDVLVHADVARLDRSLALDRGFHVGPGGKGPSAIAGRYAEAAKFIERARAEGVRVHATEVSVNRSGQALINDGRHRFAALRDSGAKTVPVAVPRYQAARFTRLFGPTE